MNMIDYVWDFTKEEFSLDLDYFNEKDQEDKMWQARTGLNFDTLCGAIETIIFMSDRPVNLLKIKQSIDSDLPLRVVHESIARLQDEYEQKHHGIRLMEVAQGYQFRTKATFANIVQRMFKVSTMQLSPTALEVLAIIAYKQPISKTQVETIRGVDSSHIVRALMDKRLVKITGRSEELGRPSLFATTQEFLEVFNLSDLSQLPSQTELDDLASANSVASIGQIREVVQKGDKVRFNFDELGELDQLSENIKHINTDTDFTLVLKDENKKASDGTDHIRKSAFDILEEYMARNEIVNMNKKAQGSDIITNVMGPHVVDVTLDSETLFNLPEEDEAMDLDAAASERELPEVKHLAESDDSEFLDQLEIKADAILNKSQELLFAQDTEDEKEAFMEALDDAFDKLMGPHLEDMNAEENLEMADGEEELQSSEDALDKSLQEMSKRAKELEIDFDFE